MIRTVIALFVPVVTGLAADAIWASSELTDERIRQLNQMLIHDCGSCHGLTLNGGLGPALTPAAMQGKPTETIRQTIVNGRKGTPMPPFGSMLSGQEIDWLVDAIKDGITRGD